MKKYLSFLAVMLTLGCSQAPVLPQGPRQFLFPYGNYQHDVRVHLSKTPPRGPQNFEFQGVFSFHQDQLKMIALSPFGTTLFRVEENLRSGEIRMDIYVEALKPYQDKIKPFYIVTRDVLTLPLSQFESGGVRVLEKTDHGFPLRLQVQEMAVQFSQYDSLDIPGAVQIQAVDFDLRVKVIGYEF